MELGRRKRLFCPLESSPDLGPNPDPNPQPDSTFDLGSIQVNTHKSLNAASVLREILKYPTVTGADLYQAQDVALRAEESRHCLDKWPMLAKKPLFETFPGSVVPVSVRVARPVRRVTPLQVAVVLSTHSLAVLGPLSHTLENSQSLLQRVPVFDPPVTQLNNRGLDNVNRAS